MKKTFLFLTIFYIISIFPLIGFAADSPIRSVNDILNILGRIVKWMYTAFFIVTVAFIILAAFNYLTAQDDAEKIKSATRQIMWAAVAVAVVLISLSFSVIIKNFIGSSGGSTDSSGVTGSP